MLFSISSGALFFVYDFITSFLRSHNYWYSLYRYRLRDCLVISICCSRCRLDSTVLRLMVELKGFLEFAVWLNSAGSTTACLLGGFASAEAYLEMSFFLNSSGPT